MTSAEQYLNTLYNIKVCLSKIVYCKDKERWEKEIQKWITIKEKLYNQYGFHTMYSLMSQFNEKHGLLKAESEYANKEILLFTQEQ